jgi:type II secretory pathway component PulJ
MEPLTLIVAVAALILVAGLAVHTYHDTFKKSAVAAEQYRHAANRRRAMKRRAQH